MTSFDQREDAFEAKFAHDQELTFKARARALRMLGLWAAGKRGKTGTAAEEYGRALIDADVSTARTGLCSTSPDMASTLLKSVQSATRCLRDRATGLSLNSGLARPF
jgi:hypothetical protein